MYKMQMQMQIRDCVADWLLLLRSNDIVLYVIKYFNIFFVYECECKSKEIICIIQVLCTIAGILLLSSSVFSFFVCCLCVTLCSRTGIHKQTQTQTSSFYSLSVC